MVGMGQLKTQDLNKEQIGHLFFYETDKPLKCVSMFDNGSWEFGSSVWSEKAFLEIAAIPLKPILSKAIFCKKKKKFEIKAWILGEERAGVDKYFSLTELSTTSSLQALNLKDFTCLQHLCKDQHFVGYSNHWKIWSRYETLSKHENMFPDRMWVGDMMEEGGCVVHGTNTDPVVIKQIVGPKISEEPRVVPGCQSAVWSSSGSLWLKRRKMLSTGSNKPAPNGKGIAGAYFQFIHWVTITKCEGKSP